MTPEQAARIYDHCQMAENINLDGPQTMLEWVLTPTYQTTWAIACGLLESALKHVVPHTHFHGNGMFGAGLIPSERYGYGHDKAKRACRADGVRRYRAPLVLCHSYGDEEFHLAWRDGDHRAVTSFDFQQPDSLSFFHMAIGRILKRTCGLECDTLGGDARPREELKAWVLASDRSFGLRTRVTHHGTFGVYHEW